ncbi:MAG: glycogen/starch synthase [Bacteroidota bacterium]
MENSKILYISQEITPFLPSSEISEIARHLPQHMLENGNEIRVFMPRFGCINERRHQLHEVIRLSGMNLVIDDADHPLIIKVASIPTARMQVYFIDNEEFFQRKAVLTDDKGKYFDDNDERSMFFCKGVLETVKKLGWKPDIVHCHGWMTAMVPFFIKNLFNEDPHFAESKLIYTAYDSAFDKPLDKNLLGKYEYEGLETEQVEYLKDASFANINKLAFDYSDAIVFGSKNLPKDVIKIAEQTGKPILEYRNEEEYREANQNFYHEVFNESSVLA